MRPAGRRARAPLLPLPACRMLDGADSNCFLSGPGEPEGMGKSLRSRLAGVRREEVSAPPSGSCLSVLGPWPGVQDFVISLSLIPSCVQGRGVAAWIPNHTGLNSLNNCLRPLDSDLGAPHPTTPQGPAQPPCHPTPQRQGQLLVSATPSSPDGRRPAHLLPHPWPC